MAEDLPPVTIGVAGLTGRPQIARPLDLIEPEYDESGNEFYAEPQASGRAMPSSCVRVLSVPRAECPVDCSGRQRDGACLCDLVRAANEQNVEWLFEIDSDGYWIYNGPALAL